MLPETDSQFPYCMQGHIPTPLQGRSASVLPPSTPRAPGREADTGPFAQSYHPGLRGNGDNACSFTELAARQGRTIQSSATKSDLCRSTMVHARGSSCSGTLGRSLSGSRMCHASLHHVSHGHVLEARNARARGRGHHLMLRQK